jgi:hypothetical protein
MCVCSDARTHRLDETQVRADVVAADGDVEGVADEQAYVI